MAQDSQDTPTIKGGGPLWQCDRCCALADSQDTPCVAHHIALWVRSRAWYTPDVQFTLCYECTLSIVLMWFTEHEEEIKAMRRAALEAP